MIETHLLCHPKTPFLENLNPEVKLELSPLGNLTLHYALYGNLADVRIPPPQTSSRVDGLWQHSCFEAFVACAGNTPYHEFNFSPSGQWAAYAFNAYRQPSEPPDGAAPRLEIVQEADRLLLTAYIDATLMPENAQGLPLEIGLSAVLETQNYNLTYWALRHPVEQPDFHHRGGFSLLLKPA